MCTTVSIATVPVLDYFSRDRHYVDVRDVAELHARALEKDEAGGQRFIVAAGKSSSQSFPCKPRESLRSGSLLQAISTGTSGVSSNPSDMRYCVPFLSAHKD